MESHENDDREMPGIPLLVSSLPTDENIDFKDTLFFKQEREQSLPSPDEIRDHARRRREESEHRGHPQPVHLKHLKLTVKFGPHVDIAEGQCLWAVGRLLKDQVPVPEIYGWRHDGGEVFLYMEYIKGVTLEESWESLEDEERAGICEELREMVMNLQQLEQDPDDQFIGEVNPLLCYSNIS